MIATFTALAHCRRGGSAGEYALLLSLICTVLVVGATALGTAISSPIDAAATQLAP